jgi:hypothetical protein
MADGAAASRRERVAVVLGGLLAFGVFFRRAFPSSVLLIRRDVFQLHLPLREYLSGQLHALQSPAWYPLDGIGVPFMGSALSMLEHPLTLGLLWLSAAQALKWQALLQYPLAALGAGLLARSLGLPRASCALAALGYALSGYLLSMSDNPTFLTGAAALPWVLWAAERVARAPTARRAAPLGALLALSVAGGDIQAFLLQCAAASAIVLFRRGRWRGRLLALVGAFLLAVLLTLPQMVPVYWAWRESARGAQGLGALQAQLWSLHPLRLFEVAFGLAYPSSFPTDHYSALGAFGGAYGGLWAECEFVGTPLIALALGGLVHRWPRRLRTYLFGGALALWLALGKHAGLYGLFWRFVPLWRSFRYPEKLMPFAVLALALAAGLGVRRIQRGDRRTLRCLLGLALVALLLLLWASPERVGTLLARIAAPEDLPDVELLAVISEQVRARLLLALGLLLPLAGLSRWDGRAAAWAALGLQFLQVWVLCGWCVGLASTSWASLDSPLRPAVEAELARAPGRICWDVTQYDYDQEPDLSNELTIIDADVKTLAPLFSARFGLSSTRAFLPVVNAFQIEHCTEEPPCGSACSRLLGATVGIVSALQFEKLTGQPGIEELQRIGNPRAVLFRDTLGRPYARLPAIKRVAGEAEAKRMISAPDFDLATSVIVGAGVDQPAPQGTIRARRVGANRIEAELEVSAPATAVLMEGCSTGWHAEVDGAPARLERADLMFCAVPVPAGRHAVVLRYTTPGWPWAWAGPAFGVALLGLFLRRTASARQAAQASA